MRIVVTGGSGFLGTHLCDFLISKGHEIVCIDNLITGNRANIDHLIPNEKFTFIKQDVTEYIDVPGAVDYIFHFASPASPLDFPRYPIQTLKVGAIGTHRALGLAKAKKAQFLLASSSEIYGEALVNPQREDYWGNVNPIGPRGVYDEAKRFAEALTLAYQRQFGMDTKIVRIFNTYGPRMKRDDGRVVPTFIVQAFQNEPLTVFGDGLQTRSFCYVSDLVEGIYKLALSDMTGPVNIGNPEMITILDFAKKVIQATGSSSTITFRPMPENDPKIRQPDITRAKELLHWQPTIALDDGLRRTIEWFRE